ncbi:MAG: TA system VapC family ribonuclease toxin [bacterium]
MLVPDVNILLYAAFPDADQHSVTVHWLNAAANGFEPVAIADMVFSSFVRIGTNPRMTAMAASSDEMFDKCREFRAMPSYQLLREGPRHWDIFERLVVDIEATGPDVADAYLAAFAVENNATFVTFDRGFTRFPGLKLLTLGD